jgi:CO dehydrogenase/acetyl-CoA synthase gamma subunit (corrinoid Fe-S protein)
MGKTGKISTIKREYNNSQLQTMDSGLSQKGMTRIPGTGVFKYPYKELDGKYRTGLDPDAAYIKRIQDPLEKELEIERVKALRTRLENEIGDIDLGPRSSFWNYGLSLSTDDQTHVQSVKLLDGDNYFDLSVPFQEIAFSWLRVHPTIASSYQAWERGEYAADTQFYVVDDEIENAVIFKKKQLINKAIVKFDSMTPEKKRKVARLLGLPVTEDTKEEVVYNQVDNVLKQTEFKNGKYSGLNPVEVFNRFADMKESLLHIKDLVKQATAHSIYRIKPNGKVYEGEFEIAKDEEDLIKFLADDDNQDELLTLEGKLKTKKLASI